MYQNLYDFKTFKVLHRKSFDFKSNFKSKIPILFVFLSGFVLIFIWGTNAPNLTKCDPIFVSIASYSDEDCPLTLISLFEEAKFPSCISIGIYQQNLKGNNFHRA